MNENNDSVIEFLKRQITITMNMVLLVNYLLEFDKELHEIAEMKKGNQEEKKGNSND